MITTADRIAASQWARNLLANPESFVIFDTETTALLQDNPEIVQIGLLRGDGTAILDCLVSPLAGTLIPAKATEIHGITDAMVQGSLSLEMLLPVLAAAMHGKTVVVYNAAQ